MVESKFLVALLLSLAGIGWGLAPAPRGAAAPVQGWHGETMPEGLERGEKEGEYLWRRDGSTMVYVAAGTFPMGSDSGDPDEKPIHQIYLDAYYIDKYEVSWKQWKRSGIAYSTDAHSRLPQPRAPDWGALDEHPMVNVTWADAVGYLVWARKRLPTEAEWEKAARGPEGRTYPWGEEPPTPDRAVWKEHPIAAVSTAAVDCCPAGASPYGAHNLAGNVYEWCQDIYDKTFYARSPARNPLRRAPGRYRVLRGGAFTLEAADLRSALRYRLLEEDRTPYIGFRGVLAAGGE